MARRPAEDSKEAVPTDDAAFGPTPSQLALVHRMEGAFPSLVRARGGGPDDPGGPSAFGTMGRLARAARGLYACGEYDELDRVLDAVEAEHARGDSDVRLVVEQGFLENLYGPPQAGWEIRLRLGPGTRGALEKSWPSGKRRTPPPPADRSAPVLDAAARRLLTERLAEAVAWCAPRARVADPPGCLRFEAMRPTGPADDLPRDSPGAMRDSVERLSRERRMRLEAGAVAIAPVGLAGGRLLARDDGRDLASGAGETASEGFLDARDVAPWETWLITLERPSPVLLAWVPPPLLVLAARGAQSCEGGCSWWADRGGDGEPLRRKLAAEIASMGLAAPPGSQGDPDADPDWRRWWRRR